MDNNTPMQGRFSDVSTSPPSDDEGLLTKPLDPLALDIDDDDLVETVDQRVKDIRHYYTEEYNLYDRRRKNEQYRFGRQILDAEKEHLMKDYESRFQDNVLYEIEGNIRAVAMSRLPDLIVTPGNDSEQSRLMAKEISKAIDTDVKSDDNRRVLSLAYAHRPVYFTGVIMIRWDPELDDYVFENVHPDMIDLDYTTPTNDAQKMRMIARITPMTVQDMLMQFPDKEAEIFKELKKDGLEVKDSKPSKKALATIVKPREVWFKWYKKHSETEYEPIWGVLWKYYNCILGKMKNPNFDYEGEERLVVYEEQGVKRSPTNDELTAATIQMMLSGQMPDNFQTEQVYHNYLSEPLVPFYFMGFDQWGKQPLDETSRLEQNVKNQEYLDKRGKLIEETLNSRGHHIFSKESGLKPSDIENLDFNDPDQDLVVDGDVTKVHSYIEPQAPDAAQFKSLNDIRQRMHELAHDNAMNGQLQSDVATSNQIARETNFTAADDEVANTINSAAQWMAKAAMHMIKLRYTEDHFKKLLGVAGEVVFQKLNRNMIEEGMEVMIKASGTDRLQAKNNAMDLAKLQMIDPVNFFRDMGYPDYEERAEMMMTFKTDLSTYMVKYVQNLQTSAEMAQALSQNPEMEMQPNNPQPQGMITPQPGMSGGLPTAPVGQVPGSSPQNPSPASPAAMPLTPPQGAPQGSPRNL